MRNHHGKAHKAAMVMLLGRADSMLEKNMNEWMRLFDFVDREALHGLDKDFAFRLCLVAPRI